MSGNKYLEEIEKTYLTIDHNFDDAFAKCENDYDRDTLISARNAAKNAFWIAVDANLRDNSPFVEKTYQGLKAANLKLQDSLQKLEDVNTIINAMEEAIRFAAAVAAMAT